MIVYKDVELLYLQWSVILQCPPLRERIVRGSSSYSPHTTPVIACRPSYYKQWTDSQMDRAVRAMLSGDLSVHHAELQYIVLHSTLGDRISGRVLPGTVSGHPAYLSWTEEGGFVRFLCHYGMMGFAKSKAEVLALVQCVLKSRGSYHQVTHGWWNSLLRQHPELTMHTAAPLFVSSKQGYWSRDVGTLLRFTGRDNNLLLQTIYRVSLVRYLIWTSLECL